MHLYGKCLPATSRDWESLPAALGLMKVVSPAGLSVTLHIYRPASELVRGLSSKVEMNMFEPSTAMTGVILCRPDSTPGPDHVTSGVTDVSTAAAVVILHVNA